MLAKQNVGKASSTTVNKMFAEKTSAHKEPVKTAHVVRHVLLDPQKFEA